MSGSTGTLWALLHQSTPVCLVLYANVGSLEDTIETVRLVAPWPWEAIEWLLATVDPSLEPESGARP